MQISAANLLLAAQQPRAASAGGNAPRAFAATSNESAARPVPTAFAPPDFEAGAPGAKKPSEAPAAAAPVRPAAGYAGLAAPGSQLDIRV